MDKLLVVGVDTLAGGNLAVTLGNRCEVIGTSWARGFELDGCRMLRVDFDEATEVAKLVAGECPRLIVYCGPSCAASWDSWHAADATVEAARAKAVEQAAVKCGSRMILLSTDAVFAGPRLFHRETFPTGIEKRAVLARSVEQALTATDTLILRTHLFGWSSGGESFGERLWTMLSEGEQPTVSGTNYATPILASDAAEFVWQAFRRRLTGLYHLGGAERISRWEFASALARTCGGTVAKSKPPAAASASLSPAGEETSLDSRRLQRALSMPLPLVHEAIGRFVDQAANGYRDRLSDTPKTKIAELSAA